MLKRQIFRLFNILIPLGAIILLFFITVFVIIIPYVKNSIFENEKKQIKLLVDSKIQIFSTLEESVKNGEISLADAQRNAISIIKDQRYGTDEGLYFWILDEKPVLLMHPHRDDLVNKYIGDYRDSEGNLLFVEMVDIAKKDGEGYLDYLWEMPDEEHQETRKKSFIKLYEPWGWIIGTGFYPQQLSAEVGNLFFVISILSFAVMGMMIILSVFIIRQRIKMNKKNIYYAESFKITERKYRDLIGQMNEGFVVVDSFFRIEMVNKKFLEMTGCSKEDLIGKSFRNIVHEDSLLLYDHNITRRKKGDNRTYEIYLKKDETSKVAALVSPRGIFNSKNEFAGSCAVFTDINALLVTQNRLKDTLAERESLIQEIHHRVKNNLQIIISLLNIEKDKQNLDILNKVFEESEARIYSMALVHEIILETNSINTIDLGSYLNRLVENLRIELNNTYSQIFYNNRMDDISISIQAASTAGITVTEIIFKMSEYYKKQKPESASDFIISINNHEHIVSSVFKIIIHDKNVGEDFKQEIDLNLVSIMASQLNGDIKVETSSTVDTTELVLTLDFPFKVN